MAKNKFTQIYEVNDVFAVMGYGLIGMSVIGWMNTQGWINLAVEVIPVDSIKDVFTGFFNFDASGNVASLVVGVIAVATEKYIKYKRFF